MLLAVAALVVAVVWAVVIAGPDDPTAGSPEAGYVAAVRLHAGEVVATIDVIVDSSDRTEIATVVDQLEAVRDEHVDLAGRAEELLAGWGIDAADLPQDPVAWMGHVVPGQIPGSITSGDLTATDGLAALVGSADGAMLMGRAIGDLSDDPDVEDLAAADLAADQALRDLAQRGRIEAGLTPVPVLSAMTTDPGQLDHGDNPVDSIGAVIDGALRLSPFFVALVLLALALRPSGRRAEAAPVVAGFASAVAGFVHLGLIGVHFDEAAVSGAFFAVAAFVQLGLGVALLLRASRRFLDAAAAVSGGVIVVFAVFRLIPPPGLVGTASVDLTGIATLILQLCVVAAWVATSTRPGPRPAAG